MSTQKSAREAKAKKGHLPSVYDILASQLAKARIDAESAMTEFNAVTSDILASSRRQMAPSVFTMLRES